VVDRLILIKRRCRILNQLHHRFSKELEIISIAYTTTITETKYNSETKNELDKYQQ